MLQIFFLELAKKFIFYLAGTLSGLLEEHITITTAEDISPVPCPQSTARLVKYQLDRDGAGASSLPISKISNATRDFLTGSHDIRK
jgi:hypothetical protein